SRADGCAPLPQRRRRGGSLDGVGGATERMIHWLSPVPVGETISGGCRKLWDLDAVLRDNGFSSRVTIVQDLPSMEWGDDLVLVPEVFGHGLDTLIPHPVRRAAFVQNGYLIDTYGIDINRPHPFDCTEDLVAVMAESDHTTDLIRARCPELMG